MASLRNAIMTRDRTRRHGDMKRTPAKGANLFRLIKRAWLAPCWTSRLTSPSEGAIVARELAKGENVWRNRVTRRSSALRSPS
jgi:hypothetical protein